PTQEGTFNPTVTVSDGYGGSASTSFTFTVVAANQNPAIDDINNQNILTGHPVSLQANATDADGDTLTYSANGLPAGLTMSSSGLISGTPTTAGTSNVTVSVSDGNGGTASTSFTITVTEN